MAKNEIVRVDAGQVVELTGGDVSAITVIYEGGDNECRIQGAAAGVTPTIAVMEKGLPLFRLGEGWMNKPMSDLFPDIASPVRVFAYA